MKYTDTSTNGGRTVSKQNGNRPHPKALEAGELTPGKVVVAYDRTINTRMVLTILVSPHQADLPGYGTSWVVKVHNHIGGDDSLLRLIDLGVPPEGSPWDSDRFTVGLKYDGDIRQLVRKHEQYQPHPRTA
jgi:hypothetical protein